MPLQVVYFKKWKSPLGDLFIYADTHNLLALTFSDHEKEIMKTHGATAVEKKASRVINKTISQLSEYFSGKRTKFKIGIKPAGTDFQKRAWGHLSKIPFGKTLTYKEQAEKIKAGKAFRAVGSANGKNPIAIIVPCHRVVGSGRRLSGYAGGTKIKAALLALEGIKGLS